MAPKLRILLAGGLLLLAPVASPEAAIYVHVDEAGIPHFTDAPTNPSFQPIPAFGLPPEVNVVRGQYADLINQIAGEEGVDPELVRAIIKAESNFDAGALSRKGAQGLMQLMPGTAGRYAVMNAFDPEKNIRGGVRHLRFLHDLFPGQLALALAAYNAGENVVLRYNGIPPYPETRLYVNRVLRYYRHSNAHVALAANRSPGRKNRNEESGAAPSLPSAVYRRTDGNGVPLYTNLPPLVRSSASSAR
ncbi:MAG TPA: lytic transglycosylase domain-containing protein [Candidatus Acidoferrum sp.]|nr:lytic transglycosylase domain-containing protein [Candidatus Acidoferrum sp.]